jgi:TonB family protein
VLTYGTYQPAMMLSNAGGILMMRVDAVASRVWRAMDTTRWRRLIAALWLCASLYAATGQAAEGAQRVTLPVSGVTAPLQGDWRVDRTTIRGLQRDRLMRSNGRTVTSVVLVPGTVSPETTCSNTMHPTPTTAAPPRFEADPHPAYLSAKWYPRPLIMRLPLGIKVVACRDLGPGRILNALIDHTAAAMDSGDAMALQALLDDVGDAFAAAPIIAPPAGIVGGVAAGVVGGVPAGIVGGVAGGVTNAAPTEPYPPPPSPAPVSAPAGYLRVGGSDMNARLTRQIRPSYPALAKRARVACSVVLQAQISKEGAVENLRVISGPPLLVQAALDAVKQWRYKPVLLRGEPVGVTTVVTVNFSLSDASDQN